MPSVDMEVFDRNPLYYTYFRSIFQGTVKKRIGDSQGRLTGLINLTSGETKELVSLSLMIHQNMAIHTNS